MKIGLAQLRKTTTYTLSFLAITFLLTTCNKKKEGDCVRESAALFITITDNNGAKIGNAIMNVFDTYQKFLDAKAAANDSSLATFTGVSLSATEAMLEVNPYIEQWMLVTYYDSVQQKYLSSENTFSKIDPLQSCSDYHITINLQAVGGVVTFWSSSTQNIPIVIKFNNVTDSLLGISPSAPVSPASPGPPNSLSFPVSSGTYQYQATSRDGCSWQGEVTIADGQFTTVELVPCARALVAFYYNTASMIPTDRRLLTVFMDNNPNPVGTLTSEYIGPTLTNSCNTPPAPNVLYVYLEPGTHSYKVQSGPGGGGTACTWTGNTGVLTTNCATNPPVYIGQNCF